MCFVVDRNVVIAAHGCYELSLAVPLYNPLIHSTVVVGHSLLAASRIASVQRVLIRL
jgi:hypothetical protein